MDHSLILPAKPIFSCLVGLPGPSWPGCLETRPQVVNLGTGLVTEAPVKSGAGICLYIISTVDLHGVSTCTARRFDQTRSGENAWFKLKEHRIYLQTPNKKCHHLASLLGVCNLQVFMICGAANTCPATASMPPFDEKDPSPSSERHRTSPTSTDVVRPVHSGGRRCRGLRSRS